MTDSARVKVTQQLDPGADVAAWVASFDWESFHDAVCVDCGRRFNARGPARVCHRHTCEHPAKVRGVMVNRDGLQVAVFACLSCGWLIKARKTDSARWTGEHVFRDRRRHDPNQHPCARCGCRSGTQSHHWAPRAIFGPEAEEWPTSWLCPECHRRWHRMMRQAAGHRIEGAWDDATFDLFGADSFTPALSTESKS